MFIQPHTLSLITTHQCTAACEHCCFACTPKVTKAIPIARLEALIDEAREVPSLRVVVFTGGECFLLGRDLDRLIARATQHGLATRCVTNGYWAASEKGARKRVAEIRAAGLKEINFSTGTFHAKYVPVERIVLGARATAEAGLTTLINAEICDQSDFGLEAIINDDRIRELIVAGKIRVQRNVWIESDGTLPLSHRPEHSRFNDGRKKGCRTAMNVIAVTPDQSLVACCGLHMEKIPDLHLGSIADRTLGDVLATAPDDFLKIWIHVEGPERVLEFVKTHKPDYELPVSCVHPCETCLHLYRDETAKAVIAEHYREKEADVVQLFLTGAAVRMASDRAAADQTMDVDGVVP